MLTESELDFIRRMSASADQVPELRSMISRYGNGSFQDVNGKLDAVRVDYPLPFWQSLAFVPNWRDYAGGVPYVPAQISKDPWNVVRLRGLVDANNTEAATQFICTLPVGYRPNAGRRHLFNQMSVTGVVRVDVWNDGSTNNAVIYMGGALGVGGWLSLDGISWIAEA